MRDYLWLDNEIQFARLISELEANGAFTNEVLETLANEMDLTIDNVCSLIDRAQNKWDKIKSEI